MHIAWIGSSFKDLKKFPEDMKDAFGYTLYLAHPGGKHVAAKPLKGFSGPGVLEIVEDNDTNTYHAVYIVKVTDTVYALHTSQEKSKSGIETPKKDLDLIKTPLQRAEKHHASKEEKKK